ncbi:hypothetical protein [Streptomyces sp. NPDC057702]|uniref:hypothetical protein n=1 Tax=unclassified Streptomyces TaxID=2593676 RepID=UPI0036C5A3AC
MPTPVWFAPWRPGPADRNPTDGDREAVLVSVTEFTAHRPWTALGVSAAGLALRRTWPEVAGAVGLWLWTGRDLARPRSGSVSVWRDAAALRDFVARHDHVRIMRDYRDRGTLRSTTWRAAPFDREVTLATAMSLLTGAVAWPRARADGEPGAPPRLA